MRLTKRQALFIKSLRVNKGYSWSAVDGEFVSRYTYQRPFDNRPLRDGNQIDGKYICDKAMKKLKESYSLGWGLITIKNK